MNGPQLGAAYLWEHGKIRQHLGNIPVAVTRQHINLTNEGRIPETNINTIVAWVDAMDTGLRAIDASPLLLENSRANIIINYRYVMSVIHAVLKKAETFVTQVSLSLPYFDN